MRTYKEHLEKQQLAERAEESRANAMGNAVKKHTYGKLIEPTKWAPSEALSITTAIKAGRGVKGSSSFLHANKLR